MNDYFESLKRSLEEAVEYSKGNLKCRTHKIKFEPVPEYTPDDIKRIRINSKLTQIGFADFLGVSAKAVEAWENGRNKPNGSARRLMSVADKNPDSLNCFFEIRSNQP
ncbi:MAG: helix-turn-helix domain-containing protein [Oscillospiraceae bacterium]|nr:helix-turn-helix domain-containing protein [Oscillospiraceae bacterium]